jgi:hypothetical protein
MLNNKIFQASDLIACDYQYEISYTEAKHFEIGEKCFLKSNPEHLMKIHSVNLDDVVCTWISENKIPQFASFPFGCILQFKFAALQKWRQKFSVCFN